jgi:hypothetical protein
MLLSDHRSILLRQRRVPEADDEGLSESKSVTMADAEGNTIVSKSQNLSLCLRRYKFFYEAADMLISTEMVVHPER